MTKIEMAERGRDQVFRFCLANGWDPPTLAGPVPGRRSCGLYDRGRIYVTHGDCAGCGYAGPAWSWPGYVIDRTPFGVYCHELGHFVDDLVSQWLGGRFATRIRKESGEGQLTGYCPNDEEWFAEMLRLFATNPDLLRLVRPRTYQLFLAASLVPAEERGWREVLAGAPARTLAMAAKKIQQAG